MADDKLAEGNEFARLRELNNAEEAVRFRIAYKSFIGRPPDRDSHTDAEYFRLMTVHQRSAADLLALAQVHATLAVADEIRAFRERYRAPGGWAHGN